MKRIIVSMALVISFGTWAAAESSVWKAQKDNSVMYLGGTCHILRDADYPLPPEFLKAYQASEVVVFETDMGELQDPATQRKFLSKAVYADGSTIDKHLSPKAYGELSAYCEANGIPLAAFRQLKPSLLMVTLTTLELMKLGVTRQGVDQFFHDLAIKDRKIVVGLETVDEQINYVVSMADGNEDEFVTYSLKELKNLGPQFEVLANAWRTGDAAKLDALMVADLKARQPQLYMKLIFERNRNWLPVIDSGRKPPRTKFVLVGAGHLVGPDGLIEALKRKGYRVDKL